MTRLPLALAGLLMAATPAAADVTPREVWDDWLVSLEEGEGEVSTQSLEETGDRVVVTGLSLRSGSAGDDSYSVEIDEIVLAQNDDGTVAVSVSPEYPVVLSGTDDEEGVEQETHLTVRHPNLGMTVSEEAGTLQHAFSAPEIRVVIERVLEDGEPLDLSGQLVLEDAEGRYDIGEATDAESTFSAASIAFDMSGTDPENGEAYTATIGMQGFDSANVLPILGTDPAGLARELPEGESLEGSFSAESTSFSFESESETETSALSGALARGETNVGLSTDGLTYSTTGQDLQMAFSGSSVPLPEVTVAIGEADLGFEVPILAQEEPQPYAFEVSMLDVSLDEGLWNMMDPAGILPRDAGEISLDISGEMDVDRDVQARTADDAGDEVRSIELDTARIAFAGAELDATGNLVLSDSSAVEKLPVGQIDVTLTGAMQLLDRLVQAGILPQEQATGARMMLSMFATPGAEDGALVSAIRFTEDGHVFVNDQQVR